MEAIGIEITRRAKRSGMRVLSVSRSSKMGIDGLDSHFTVDKMDNALRYADYVVVAIPYTPKTKNLINENVIASMKPGAYFVNMARGEVIVEDDLVRALSNGHLAGAALDVFSQEPLPDDSRLLEGEKYHHHSPHFRLDSEIKFQGYVVFLSKIIKIA